MLAEVKRCSGQKVREKKPFVGGGLTNRSASADS